jgi:aminopeptidase N
MLNPGDSTIDIQSMTEFSRESTGMHKVFCSDRNETYIYSVCPPNWAHVIYPCFDQPDLKGIYTTKIEAPRDWVVICNTPLINESISEEKSESKIFYFEETPPLSTYLFSVALGDFACVEFNDWRIPIRFFGP